jgi:hypothetical protein
MIAFDMEQNSPEWLAVRLGRPTASAFSKIITPKEMKLSKSSRPYLNELVAEWVLGYSPKDDASLFMERGHEIEPEAIKYYEMVKDVKVQRVGFCMLDDGSAGCSPDGLVGEDGGLEVKCLGAIGHVDYLLNGDFSEYRAQIQGGLWITGRAWWDFLAYHPNMPPLLVRVERDEVFIAALAAAVTEFAAKLALAKDQMRAGGTVAVLDNLEVAA